MDEEIKVSDFEHCYICGAEQKSDGCSLHCWNITYTCGCEIWGALGNNGIYLYKKCSKDESVKH